MKRCASLLTFVIATILVGATFAAADDARGKSECPLGGDLKLCPEGLQIFGAGGDAAPGLNLQWNLGGGKALRAVAVPEGGQWQGLFGGAMPGGPDVLKLFGEVKKVKATYLGVAASRAPAAIRSQLSLPSGVGLVVETVEPDSPAAKAELKQHDVLHKLNDQILIAPDQLAVLVRMHKPGDEVTLTVLRQAKPLTLKAKLTENEVPDLDAWQMPAHGAFVIAPDGGQPNLPMPKVMPFPGFGGAMPGFGGAEAMMSFADGEHSMQITVKDGKPLLVATDAKGKEIFRGPIGTDEEIKAVPEVLRKKLESVQGVVTSGAKSFSLPLKPSADEKKSGDETPEKDTKPAPKRADAPKSKR